MNKLLAIFAAVVMLSSAGLMARAAEDKEVTVEGKGQCAKCSLNETATCQNAIVTEEDGKEVTYYLAKNKVANDFHSNICKKTEMVKATGTVKEEDGMKILTASKIEVVKGDG